MLLLSSFLYILIISSQLSGVVKNEKGHPLKDAVVTIPSLMIYSVTDSAGRYKLSISDSSLGKEFIIVTHLAGYLPDTLLTTLKPVETRLDITLEEQMSGTQIPMINPNRKQIRCQKRKKRKSQFQTGASGRSCVR